MRERMRTTCRLCPWELEFPPELDPEDDELARKAVTTVHVALRHPKEFEDSVGKPAKTALELYRERYGDEFALTAVLLEQDAMERSVTDLHSVKRSS